MALKQGALATQKYTIDLKGFMKKLKKENVERSDRRKDPKTQPKERKGKRIRDIYPRTS